MTNAVNTTLALIAHRQGEGDLVIQRARYIWDLCHVHGLSLRAITSVLQTELRSRGVTDDQIGQLGREGLGISHSKVQAITSGPRP